jgi:thiamine biosynthesis lipoprotein ApbE
MHILSLGLSGVLSAIPNQATENSKGILLSEFEDVLGTSLDLKISANSNENAQKAEQKVLIELSRLQQILGSYGENNEFAQWKKTYQQKVEVSKELVEIAKDFDFWKEQSQGAINPASEEFTQLWKKASKTGIQPSEAELKELIEKVRENHWVIEGSSLSKTSDADLKLHTFTKLYIAEKVADLAIASEGVDGIVVNIGGDIVVKGDINEKVKVADPQAAYENATPISMVEINNKTIASSGNYRRGVELNGQHLSHIINPATGKPADQIASATVIHENAVTAGALATAFNILPLNESISLANKFHKADYLIVDHSGNQFQSDTWPALAKEEQSSISFVQLKEKTWNPKMECSIDFEIANLGGYARRPYVAIWIEDEKGNPVRRIALWYRKPRWLVDLRYWSSGSRNADYNISSITGATRGAGKYSVVWDGKDDAGQYINQGNYTVIIEAAREHGSYQLMKQTMKFDDKAKAASFTGNEEISAAKLNFTSK